MRRSPLLFRSLTYYWRTNLAVVAGVASAVSVLAGALLVGDSVGESLRDLVLQRLGNTDYVVSSAAFFREQLSRDLESTDQFQRAFQSACPIILLDGVVTHQESGRRASEVFVYGVDARFWRFQGRADRSSTARSALVSPGLGDELGAGTGDTLLIRFEKPSDIPVESLHGRKEESGATLRLRIQDVLPASELGEFSIRARQERVRAVFVPLQLMQQQLGVAGQVNTLLVAVRPLVEDSVRDSSRLLEESLQASYALEDVGLRVQVLERLGGLSLESTSTILRDDFAQSGAETATRMGLVARPALIYLANAIRSDSREIPYSVVAAIDTAGVESIEPPAELPPIVLNQWAAEDLRVKPGDRIALEYYLWGDGKLRTESATFRLSAVLPMNSEMVDPELTPKYPGITESTRITDWDPPFPMDMKRIRPRDEQYWQSYRTSPKAFVPLKIGQLLWATRFGKLTSQRMFPQALSRARNAGSQAVPSPPGIPSELQKAYAEKLKQRINPARDGFLISAAKAEGLQASHGAADFGEYFLYFSFFLVVSALLLTALFFRLGIEQRLKEIGILRVSGFNQRSIQALFLSEGLVLCIAGCALGMAGALLYSRWIMFALGTWWAGAVNTPLLRLHVSASSLACGAAGGIVTAVLCIAWTLRSLRNFSARALIVGSEDNRRFEGKRFEGERLAGHSTSRLSNVGLKGTRSAAAGTALAALLLLSGSRIGPISPVLGFFGAGTLLLVSFLLACRLWLHTRKHALLSGFGWKAIAHLGIRSATYRPGRSLLCIALIASATFIIVAVSAFRKGEPGLRGVNSGTGGFALLAESVVPLPYDPNTPEGKAALGLGPEQAAILENVHFERFRLRPGDDTSCLNLYQARDPRILAPSAAFISAARFRFLETLAQTAEERANPWLLLNRSYPDEAIPVIADANSMKYVLHLKLGEELALPRSGRSKRLKVVASLDDSLFQKELLVSEKNFFRLFSDLQGFRFFLLDAKPGSEAAVTGVLEDRLSDFGLDVSTTEARLAGFHQVENTYLSTFQFLGSFGLLLGTLGLAAVLWRNVVERRRELALLRSAGFTAANLGLMIIAENLLLLVTGVAAGTGCAAIAILPAFYQRGGELPFMSMLWLLSSVTAAGVLASLIATKAALRAPLLATLRS
jgi:ABC-type antimicrobial peptide transport system permease subunit